MAVLGTVTIAEIHDQKRIEYREKKRKRNIQQDKEITYPNQIAFSDLPAGAATSAGTTAEPSTRAAGSAETPKSDDVQQEHRT